MSMKDPNKRFRHLPKFGPTRDVFYTPSVDGGIRFFDKQLPGWTLKPRIEFRVVSCVTPDQGYSTKLHNLIYKTEYGKVAESSYCLSTVPAVVNMLSTSNLNYSIQGKLCIFGRIGEIVEKSYYKKNVQWMKEIQDDFNRFYSEVNRDPFVEFNVVSEFDNLSTDYVIVCRNLFNYYHFIAETLCQLCLVEDIPNFSGQIYIVHFGNKVLDFVSKFIETLFPEIKEKIHIVSKSIELDQAIIPYQSSYDALLSRKGSFERFSKLQTANTIWNKKNQFREAQRKEIYINGHESTLVKLRTRALKKIPKDAYPNTPKRIWISRSEHASKKRLMQNEEIFLQKLKPLGFVEVILEKLQPEEQIATFQNAEFVLGQHGAGLVNMLFASSSAYIFEIGNFLSLRNRLGNWAQFANISQCSHVIIAADIADDFLDQAKKNIDELAPIKMSLDTIDRTVAMIKTILDIAFNPSKDELALLFVDLAEAKLWDQLSKLMQKFDHIIGEDARIILACVDYYISQGYFEDADALLSILFFMEKDNTKYYERLILLCNKAGYIERKTSVLNEAKSKCPDNHFLLDLIAGIFPEDGVR